MAQGEQEALAYRRGSRGDAKNSGAAFGVRLGARQHRVGTICDRALAQKHKLYPHTFIAGFLDTHLKCSLKAGAHRAARPRPPSTHPPGLF